MYGNYLEMAIMLYQNKMRRIQSLCQLLQMHNNVQYGLNGRIVMGIGETKVTQLDLGGKFTCSSEATKNIVPYSVPIFEVNRVSVQNQPKQIVISVVLQECVGQIETQTERIHEKNTVCYQCSQTGTNQLIVGWCVKSELEYVMKTPPCQLSMTIENDMRVEKTMYFG